MNTLDNTNVKVTSDYIKGSFWHSFNTLYSGKLKREYLRTPYGFSENRCINIYNPEKVVDTHCSIHNLSLSGWFRTKGKKYRTKYNHYKTLANVKFVCITDQVYVTVTTTKEDLSEVTSMVKASLADAWSTVVQNDEDMEVIVQYDVVYELPNTIIQDGLQEEVK